MSGWTRGVNVNKSSYDQQPERPKREREEKKGDEGTGFIQRSEKVRTAPEEQKSEKPSFRNANKPRADQDDGGMLKRTNTNATKDAPPSRGPPRNTNANTESGGLGFRSNKVAKK